MTDPRPDLCTCSLSVHDVLMFLSLSYVGVHQDHHDLVGHVHEPLVFNRNGCWIFGFKEKSMSRAHGTMVFVMENACQGGVESISIQKPMIRTQFPSKIEGTALSKQIVTLKPSGAVHEPMCFEEKSGTDPSVFERNACRARNFFTKQKGWTSISKQNRGIRGPWPGRESARPCMFGSKPLNL